MLGQPTKTLEGNVSKDALCVYSINNSAYLKQEGSHLHGDKRGYPIDMSLVAVVFQ